MSHCLSHGLNRPVGGRLLSRCHISSGGRTRTDDPRIMIPCRAWHRSAPLDGTRHDLGTSPLKPCRVVSSIPSHSESRSHRPSHCPTPRFLVPTHPHFHFSFPPIGNEKTSRHHQHNRRKIISRTAASSGPRNEKQEAPHPDSSETCLVGLPRPLPRLRAAALWGSGCRFRWPLLQRAPHKALARPAFATVGQSVGQWPTTAPQGWGQREHLDHVHT